MQKFGNQECISEYGQVGVWFWKALPVVLTCPFSRESLHYYLQREDMWYLLWWCMITPTACAQDQHFNSEQETLFWVGPLLASPICSRSLKTPAGNKTAAPKSRWFMSRRPTGLPPEVLPVTQDDVLQECHIRGFYKTHSSVAASVKSHNCPIPFKFIFNCRESPFLPLFWVRDFFFHLFAMLLFIKSKPKRRKDIMKDIKDITNWKRNGLPFVPPESL